MVPLMVSGGNGLWRGYGVLAQGVEKLLSVLGPLPGSYFACSFPAPKPRLSAVKVNIDHAFRSPANRSISVRTSSSCFMSQEVFYTQSSIIGDTLINNHSFIKLCIPLFCLCYYRSSHCRKIMFYVPGFEVWFAFVHVLGWFSQRLLS